MALFHYIDNVWLLILCGAVSLVCQVYYVKHACIGWFDFGMMSIAFVLAPWSAVLPSILSFFIQHRHGYYGKFWSVRLRKHSKSHKDFRFLHGGDSFSLILDGRITVKEYVYSEHGTMLFFEEL